MKLVNMTLVFIPYIFHEGYASIVKRFWDVPDFWEPTGKFDNSPVYFLDTEETDEDFCDLLSDQLSGKNETITKINIKGEEFEVFELNGDGGFWTILILAEDITRFVTATGMEVKDGLPTDLF